MVWYICVAVFVLMTGYMHIEASATLKKTYFYDNEKAAGLGTLLLLVFGLGLCITPAFGLANAYVLHLEWRASDLIRLFAVITWSIIWMIQLYRVDIHIYRTRHTIHMHLGGRSNIC
ncbi:MAG: hypothetical protein JWL80_361 [Parcubacteria group bacterium]|nr:hypothetical protein [Parcubacteria group bacterium]